MEAGHAHVANGADVPSLAGGADECAIEISAVPLAEVGSVWPKVSHWLIPALEKAPAYDLTPGMLYRWLETGECVLLVVHQGLELMGAAVLGKSTDKRGMRYLSMPAVGGDRLAAWCGLMAEAVRQVARDAGMQRVVLQGRPGWWRWLQPHGVRRHAVVLVWDVEG